MSEEFDTLFKLLQNRDLTELTRIPTADEAIAKHLKKRRTRFPLRVLGWATDGEVILTEEERTHTHILGLPGQGKSKLLEFLIRGDIDNLVAGRTKAGLCLIDSSDFGNTYYKVLKYCAKVGYPKVCLIDPKDAFRPNFKKLATLNPIHYRAPVDVVVGSVLEIVRILWDSEEWNRTAKIQEYLHALVDILHETEGTIHDLRYFKSKKKHNEVFARRREAMLALVSNPGFSNAWTTIQDAFSYHDSLFINEFSSTIRRLDPVLASKTLPLMVASNASPINFQKMVAEGWVVLCNLDPQVWDVPQQKFLGTLIISEVVQASYRLAQRRLETTDVPVPPYYLYIDEIGRYATTTLSDVMNYKRTSNIKLIMAHQDMSQIKNEEVRKAVLNCPTKVMFYVENEDRTAMVRRMYGGDVPIAAASYALSDLQQREADIRIGFSGHPRKTRLADLPDIAMSRERVDAYKTKLYQQPWYKTRREIYDEINARFKPEPRSVRPQQPGDPGGNRKPTRGSKKVAVSPAPSDDGANRQTGQPASGKRGFKSVFSEEED